MEKYECPICEQTFNGKKNLSNHMRLVHERRKPFKCSEKVFHKFFECKTCEKSFREKADLKRHYDSHLHIKRAQILVDASMAHEG